MKPIILALITGLFSLNALAAPPASLDDAAAFGAREAIFSAALSADGKKLVYVGAGTEASTIAVVVDLVTGTATQVARADGNPINISNCQWSAADRIVCQLHGLQRFQGVLVGLSRTLAMDADGKNQLFLGQKDTLEQVGKRFGDGWVVDWMNGTDGAVLMSRSYVPEQSTGRLLARKEEGVGVDRVDTRTGKSTQVERPGDDVSNYISDGLGNIRIMSTAGVAESGMSRGVEMHSYRAVNDRAWRPLGTYAIDRNSGGQATGIIPRAVDSRINAAYVLDALDGRWALYRITLDESLKRELVIASKEVDVDDVVTVGRGGRVIGATYATDRRYVQYFDPDYKALHDMLSKALPKQPMIDFLSASADEQTLVVHASGDIDPGTWYVYYRDKKALSAVSAVRPGLKGKTLSTVKAISYPAADGTMIPAYLTLPPGVTEAKNLPAIVLPHGGPWARDEWGFDWLSQYFAQRGFVVLQPNFRGSAGYGSAWFANNGFQGWKTSVGDVCDAGRWLVAQGMADASKLGIVGWSYGGYAALQANVLDADLFKAVVAVAPVTDLAMLKTKGMTYADGAVMADVIGSGPHIKEGSPAQNPQTFKAPVLMFQGDMDVNVDIGQSRYMDKELRRAGKSSELIVYPKLEHSLRDSNARADMLRKSDAFLRKQMKF
jgi:dipeptidyl aminopeptidase/acylaminoacyl peptidase